MINHARWEITSKCNLNCKHCAVNEVHREDISLPEAKQIVDKMASQGVKEILFSTKEPFAYKYIWDLFAYCTKLNIYIKLVTNGTLLNEDDVKRLYQYKIKMFSISLDGWNETDNDLIRGKGTFNKILKTIELISKYNRDPKYSFIPLFVQNCFTSENLKTLSQIKDLFDDYGDLNISLTPIVLLGNAKKNKSIRTTIEQMEEYEDSLYGMIYKVNPKMFVRESTYYGSLYHNYTYRLNQSPFYPSCMARDPDLFSVLSDGKLCKCVMLLDSDVNYPGQMVFDNAKDNFGEIHSERIDDSFYKNNDVCRKCDIKDECQQCLAISLSPEALTEQITKCEEDMNRFEKMLADVVSGKIRSCVNKSIVLYDGSVTMIFRTLETRRYRVETNIYNLLVDYLGTDCIPCEKLSELTYDEIKFLVVNNFIWRAE